MAPTVTHSGTSSTLSGTPYTIGAARTDGKTYIVQLDLNNLAAGDIAVLEVLTKVTTGSTARVTDRITWANTQSGQPNFMSIPYAAPYSIEFKITQPTGTGRTVDYALMSID